ncbi:MAG: 4-carboxymuconolactone decarboxylase [Proteobacteria bacterium]|nr:MAG: 4-carboxymuconolactone decarboxylase [Pseudomonadota bacterium]
MSDERRAKGLEWFDKVMGFRPPVIPDDPFLDATVDHLFAGVWARPGLGVKERRIATLVVLMQLGNEQTLRLHFGAAMKQKQLTDTEIDELILHVAHYAGWPVAAISSQIVRALRAERDKAAKASG